MTRLDQLAAESRNPDAWVRVFDDKVREIRRGPCRPMPESLITDASPHPEFIVTISEVSGSGIADHGRDQDAFASS